MEGERRGRQREQRKHGGRLVRGEEGVFKQGSSQRNNVKRERDRRGKEEIGRDCKLRTERGRKTGTEIRGARDQERERDGIW